LPKKRVPKIYDCFDFIKNCDEWKEIAQELIYSDYTLENIFDFLIINSFRFHYKFVVSIFEEDAVVSDAREFIEELIKEDVDINNVELTDEL
jgi:hypothetical protein